ncbi:MAG TPA: isoleucine--tRNA ligase [Bacteroidales bacterium]|nr:isoleucine--tRNA ligase [Bacteroidales bacterium]HRT90658.1 isoleucine--tRNA ligase [Bacteroidales bacterium]
MGKKFPEYKGLDLAEVNKEILKVWDENNTFRRSVRQRDGRGEFVFYEGPPSANGMPGIHHVMSRAIKDAVCRYKAQCGYEVKRKAGWDTHGLPVELGVEKALGITKEDIGTKISIADYNRECKKDVMKYTDLWEELTRKMGYWIDMDDPYITYDNRYIETLWWLLKQLYTKGYLYKGYTIQPYSPAAGTGLSSHELNLPGCYRDVKDTTCIALFSIDRNEKSEFLFKAADTPSIHIMAWTTTPWTLPSNTGLAVGEDIIYTCVRTYNPYTGEPLTAILAKELLGSIFPGTEPSDDLPVYKPGDRKVPYRIISEFPGEKLRGITYRQLIDWVNPGEGAFRVETGDFVTTADGTGIVHIAPTFGADDYNFGRKHGIPPLMVRMKDGSMGPLVDKRGFMVPVADLDEEFVRQRVNTETYKGFEGRPVKNEYDPSLNGSDETLDIDIAVMLKQSGKAFRIEKMVHSYPHCWRTDKPVLYYPLDSWFIRTTAFRDRLIELNNTINWKPPSTGSGRFGKWLENLVDWNLSRSRFWGTPLPIWVTDDRSEEKCIGSVTELKEEIEKAVRAGFMKENPLAKFRENDFSKENYDLFDLHRPFVDEVILVSPSGKKMFREPDLIDVWFDSGAMPYAQAHYPFENKQNFSDMFPADFIAEGVDQTRGWFFTLHAIATMISDSVSFKNIVSNGLVLDKNGNKMSKRLGNAVDPFSTIDEHGADAVRWYMLTNAQPWDNLKFDISGVEEVKRKFFGTLYNTYAFFALYANIDGFDYSGGEVPVDERPEIDRWIISLLNSLVKEVGSSYADYDLTRAARAIQDFVTENLSNWYVRLNRKRFWGGEQDRGKLAAYQTLYTCLETVCKLAAPVAPFYADRIFMDLNSVTGRHREDSVHLTAFPEPDEKLIDRELEERMEIAQRISSMILGIRRKVNIKVRQPLAKIMLPVSGDSFVERFESVRNLVLSEVNVRDVEYIKDTTGIVVKKIKPDFRVLGPKYGKLMKDIAGAVSALSQEEITAFETEGRRSFVINGAPVELSLEDVEIISEDIPGWQVATDGKLTVALDITVTDELRYEGIAREFVNRIQNLRKEKGFEVTDKIIVHIGENEFVNEAVRRHAGYIGSQTLATEVKLVPSLSGSSVDEVDIDEVIVKVAIRKNTI